MHQDPALARALDGHPHATEGGQGGQGVLALQEPGDPSLALGQGPEHDRAMGDGLVARDLE